MGHALRAAVQGIASDIGDLLAVGLVPLLPVLLTLAVLRLGPGLWPPLDPLRPALAIAGLAAALLLARQRLAGDRWPAALTLAAAALLLGAAALAAWPLARPRAGPRPHWRAGLCRPEARLGHPAAPGPAWLTWGVSAAVLLLPLALFQQALVIRPVRTLARAHPRSRRRSLDQRLPGPGTAPSPGPPPHRPAAWLLFGVED